MAKAYYIPNGPKNLEPVFPGIDFDNIAEYYLELLDDADTVIATTTMNKLEACKDEDDIFRIFFLNSLGAVDGIDLTRKSTEKESKSDSWEKPVQYPLSKPEHAINRSNVKSNKTISLVSYDYEEQDGDWIEELFESPVAWMQWAGTQGQADNFIPVVIVDKKWSKVQENDRFNYEVALEVLMSHERFIIRN
jgi:hypothetical protein